MRVLASFAGGVGHLQPMLPLLRALTRRGHEVLLTGDSSALVDVDDAISLLDEPEPPRIGTRQPLVPPDLAHEHDVIARHYAGALAERRLGELGERIGRLRPDVVLCDSLDFGAMLAAEHRGLPLVVVEVIATGALVRPVDVVRPLAALRRRAGPATGGVPVPALLVVPFPPSLRTVPGANPHHVQPGDGAHHHRSDAVEWLGSGSGPRALFTLGTVFNTESGDLFERVLAGLAQTRVRTLVTVGRTVDPQRLGPQPDHIRVERLVPLATALPFVDLVVSHAGSGSAVAALAHGIPQLLVPIGADQELTAQRIVALGAGSALDPVTLSGSGLASSIASVLRDGRIRRGAERIRNEIAALPDVASLLPSIELLG